MAWQSSIRNPEACASSDGEMPLRHRLELESRALIHHQDYILQTYADIVLIHTHTEVHHMLSPAFYTLLITSIFCGTETYAAFGNLLA